MLYCFRTPCLSRYLTADFLQIGLDKRRACGKLSKMTHKESQQLRSVIVAYVDEGASISAAAKHFDVGPDRVREACHQHGITWKREYHGVEHHHVDPFRVLAALRTDSSLAAVSKTVGLTRERVRQIKDRAVKFGVLKWVDNRRIVR